MNEIAAPESPAVHRRFREILYPTLYEVNTRVLLRGLQGKKTQPSTLDDVPDSLLDGWAERGFEWIWLLGVWQTGPAGQRISRTNPEFVEEFRLLLHDYREDDVCGSCFAITGYTPGEYTGGSSALARMRKRLAERNLKLMLDFVPNHTGLDHPWIESHPEYYIAGSEDDLVREPKNYCRLQSGIFAYGRDPYFSGWPDTLQLNYAEPRLQEAMRAELLRIAGMCDGVRCDMAMLLLPDVFERTWHRPSAPFWPTTVSTVKAHHPDFRFLAEVYWDREWELQQQGFDYTYDKHLYDRLRGQSARSVRDHLKADPAFQTRSARFLENHDEPRAAEVFPEEIHKAAAVITFFIPGLRFFHDGQFEGFKARIPVHLDRGPAESINSALSLFYERLLKVLGNDACGNGTWQLLDCTSAWDGNWTHDNYICFAWSLGSELEILALTNYSPHQSQCFTPLPFEGLRGQDVRLSDALSDAQYDRSGNDLANKGLYLDMTAWGIHVFKVTTNPS